MSRQCGSCSLCCTALAVPEIGKANGERCEHLTRAGKCSIYDDRPESCRAFECLWLRGTGGPSVRPDRTGAVLTREDGGAGPEGDAVVFYTVPGDERYKRSKYLQRITMNAMRRSSGVFVVAGEGRTCITLPGSRLAKALDRMQQEGE